MDVVDTYLSPFGERTEERERETRGNEWERALKREILRK